MGYSICSLVLGSAAWVLGAARLVRRRGPGLSALSWGACAAALYIQLAMISALVDAYGGMDTMEDIAGGIYFGATVMLAVTLLLHLAAVCWEKWAAPRKGGGPE